MLHGVNVAADYSYLFCSFPLKNKELLQAWNIAIGREDFTPTTSSKVCSIHFRENDYLVRPGAYVKRLKPDAIPSIFPALPDRLKRKQNSRRILERKTVPENSNFCMEIDLTEDDDCSIVESTNVPTLQVTYNDQSMLSTQINKEFQKKVKTLPHIIRRKTGNMADSKGMLKSLNNKKLFYSTKLMKH